MNDDYGIPAGFKTGCLPRTDKLGAEFDVFEDHITPFPRSKWAELAEKSTRLGELVKKCRDQDGIGSCASDAASQCNEMVRNLELGKGLWLEMCSISIYQTVSGGRDRGSSIDSNLRFMRDKGVLPADTPENKKLMRELGLDENHVMRNRVFPQRYPNGWEETAKHFCVEEWYDIASIEGFVTALYHGFPVSYGSRAHAKVGLSLVRRDGTWKIAYQNSWSESWGEAAFGSPGGVGYESVSQIEAALPSYGAYAVRQVRITEPFLTALKE